MAVEIKALESIYRGYKFRSRIEARWAVFFDTLGIPYQYEKEGFDLNGTWYLPDFWLPEQKCWIEIKGKAPTAQEQEKADLLQLYTGHPVHTFYGDVWIPSETSGRAICQIFELYGDCHSRYRHIEIEGINPQLLYILYCLDKYGVCLVTKSGSIDTSIPAKLPINIHHAIHKMINEYYDALALLLCPFDRHAFRLNCCRSKSRWVEYPCCHRTGIKLHAFDSDFCDCEKDGDDHEYYLDERGPRILKAYTAARQARFDGRK